MKLLPKILLLFPSLFPALLAAAGADLKEVKCMNWSFDQVHDKGFPERESGAGLKILRNATLVPGIDGGAVRLSRLDCLSTGPMSDPVTGGRFSVGLWIKVEWASRRFQHGDVLNFVAGNSNNVQPSPAWRIGFSEVKTRTLPRGNWPLVLRIGEKFDTEELPILVDPWRWTHVAFVGDGNKIGVYKNGGLLGYVDLPEGGLKIAGERAGVLQVNGSPCPDREGTWECDIRVDDLVLSNGPEEPNVAYPAYLREPTDTRDIRLRLRSVTAADPDDAFLIESMLRKAEQCDNGRDSADIRGKYLSRALDGVKALEKGMPPMRNLAGHLRLSYLSPVDQSEQFYEVYVPKSRKPEGKTPLVVALHGSGEDETVYFERYSIEEEAERYGWIVVTPYGRCQDGYRTSGEKDVLDVIRIVRRQWNIDGARIYVTGHSMGGSGTAFLVRENPGLFAAGAPVAGWASVEDMKILGKKPMLWVVGDKDKEWATGTVGRMMEAAKKVKAPHASLVLKGYDHGGFLGSSWPTVVEVSLPKVFEFFSRNKAD
jgi:predicted esterase